MTGIKIWTHRLPFGKLVFSFAIIICSFWNLRQASNLPGTHGISQQDHPHAENRHRPISMRSAEAADDIATFRHIIVDVLSIGSKHRPEFQKRQVETFGSHRSIRNFFLADERVDADPECGETLTTEDVGTICDFCRLNQTWHAEEQWIMSRMRHAFITLDKLKGKHAPGWLCAQSRPLYALYQVQEYYETSRTAFPDYFLLVDDDTYYHMPKYELFFGLKTAPKPRAVAGCGIKFHTFYRIPYGGFGFTLSQGLMEIIMTPVDCQHNSNKESKSPDLNPEKDRICTAVRRNGIGELSVFEEQMQSKGTLVELMKGYADQSPFRNFRNWTTGFCMHSDWATAYFLALLRSHDEQSTDIPMRVYNARPGMRSVFPVKKGFEELNICTFVGDQCTAESEACHYIDDGIMSSVFQEQQHMAPSEFGIPPTVVQLYSKSYG